MPTISLNRFLQHLKKLASVLGLSIISNPIEAVVSQNFLKLHATGRMKFVKQLNVSQDANYQMVGSLGVH